MKNDYTLSNILLLKSAGEKTILRLKKQRFKCKNCQHTFLGSDLLSQNLSSYFNPRLSRDF
ncbi:transposase family protein [Lactovum miscens]|uniref:transposase family protein n=1 Tax=Lactovum miscens TaxID=190387 RepID=UPI0039C8DCA7